MNARTRTPSRRHIRMSGLTLVELMIAMVLGLIVIGGVINVVVSNGQTYRTNEALSQIQDSARTAFELLARDIREAGGSPCGNDIPVVNVLNSAQGANTPWGHDWDQPVQGYGGEDALAGAANRIAGTDALSLLSGRSSGVTVENFTQDSNSGANFTVSWPTKGQVGDPGHGLSPGSILFVCNHLQGSIFQMTGPSSSAASNELVVSNSGSTHVPGNCTKGLGPIIPGNNVNNPCDTNGNPGPFSKNSVIARLSNIAWYVGDNGRPDEGGRSLYRISGAAATEMVPGVSNMTIRYRVDGADTFDTAPVAWANVNAIEIDLTVTSIDQRVSVDGNRLQRNFRSVVTLRNRVQ